ncbi:MAG TPA: hypothetical protein VFA85_18660 [Terriglobales bacterium]|nr:hypothetical protein [Terriglobales bacterium]
MKARIKTYLAQSALRSALQRRPRTKKVNRKVMATAMIVSGMSAKEIAWHMAWPLADVQELCRIFSRLR